MTRNWTSGAAARISACAASSTLYRDKYSSTVSWCTENSGAAGRAVTERILDFTMAEGLRAWATLQVMTSLSCAIGKARSCAATESSRSHLRMKSSAGLAMGVAAARGGPRPEGRQPADGGGGCPAGTCMASIPRIREIRTAELLLALVISLPMITCWRSTGRARSIADASSSMLCRCRYSSTCCRWPSSLCTLSMRESTTAEGFRALVRSVKTMFSCSSGDKARSLSAAEWSRPCLAMKLSTSSELTPPCGM
mmetsp:Transcript_64806/g.134321  ORF Transcript_64806/g.134321 Transcript_64806/m.134321 type:complete len:253 (-) Transcript_64806:409-1167(-)